MRHVWRKKGSFEVIVTVGPATFEYLPEICKCGPCLFRINGAHVSVKEVEEYVDWMRAHVPGAKILLDLPGNRRRFKRKGQPVEDADHLPFLFEEDYALVDLACAHGIDILSASFVRTVEDIDLVRGLLDTAGGGDIDLFAKIETGEAVGNRDAILDRVSTVNMDRGDLSSAIGLYDVPWAQREVIKSAHKKHRRVFLATCFLKSMEKGDGPTLSEIAAISQAVQQGVTGIQLSEETAIGRQPLACVQTLFDIARLAGAK